MAISKPATGRPRRLKSESGCDRSYSPLPKARASNDKTDHIGARAAPSAGARQAPADYRRAVQALSARWRRARSGGSAWKKAFGTVSSDFVNASLFQLQSAARLPCSGISEIGMNAALALIEAAAPKDEIEGALAVQMACTHTGALSVLARFGSGGGTDRRVVALASAAARLLRAYSGTSRLFAGCVMAAIQRG